MFKHFFKHVLVLLIIACRAITPLFSQTPAKNKPSTDFSTVEALINDAIAQGHVPSVSIAIVYKGNIILEKSFGWADRERQVRATIHTPYYLASVTKAFTTTALVTLAGKQLLDWNKPVNNYLGNGLVHSPLWNVSEATVRTIANHTSGLTTYDRDCYTDESPCVIAMDTIINRYGILFREPGHFDYSNIGYGILGEAVAHVSGKPLATYLEETIFTPLGMKDSYLKSSTPIGDGKNRTVAIRYRPDSLYNRSPDVISTTPGGSSAYSSIHDLASFTLFHLGHATTANKKMADLSVGYRQQLQDNAGGGRYYSLGWWLDSNFYSYKRVMAQGGTIDASAYVELIPSEDIGVIVLSNSGSVNAQQIINEALAVALPGFRQQVTLAASAEKKSPPPAIVYSADSLSGKWSGFISTYKQKIPLSLTITPAGDVSVRIDQGEPMTVVKPAFRQRRIFFLVPGNLDVTEDTGKDPYNLHFYLNQQQDMLYGPVTTEGKGNREERAPRLSFWVQLTKLNK